MPQLISIDWESDDLTGVEAGVGDGRTRIRRCFNLVWPESIVPEEEPQRAGEWLASALEEAGVTADRSLVVLPREAVVVRRLDLPNAPDSELPDLVRFQAATKSSTSLDRLVLDYVPLPTEPDATGRQVLMVTVDSARLKVIRDVFRAAGVELQAVGISPVAVAEVVAHMEGEQSADPLQATMVVYQDTHRVEITILQQRQIVFSHQTRLAGSDDAGGIRSSLVEINRASVALSQSQHDVQVTKVCLIHAGDADPALETALDERFRGQLRVLDIATASGVSVDQSVDPTNLAAYAPAIGMLLSQGGAAQVPAVDFLHPRRREEKQDRTRLKAGLAAASVLLLGGIGYLMFRSHLSGLNEQIEAFSSQEGELRRTLKAGAAELESAAAIGAWISGGRDPLEVMSDLQKLGPGTARLYLEEYTQEIGSRDAVARISGLGYAKSREDVEDLHETLERAGYRVLPNVTMPSRVDPDYPFEFQLELQILQPESPTNDRQDT